ncbi:hypothetical protein Taro_053137 [Colocasia esculenta]|uniref:FAD-binding domain-containing protein n=1 Tax=Colocasia esculenta TaxID=4460 RepID=A0A843XLP6_COLES|nr:hypothetical protein [Colocasia esculenta]
MESSDNCEDLEVVIVGAGIAGLATALALKRIGAEGVVVLERVPCLRTTGAALSLFPNAWRALDVLGVAHKLIPLYPSFERGTVTNITTGVTQEMYFPSSGGMGVRAVHRATLLESLSEELPLGTVRFSTNITSISTESPEDPSSRVVLHLDDGTVIKAKVLIGCDGVHSAVAQWLGLSAPVDSGRAAVRGLSVYPDGHGFKSLAQQLLSKNERAGCVSINDKEIYWFVVNKSNPSDGEMARDPELILEHVTGIMAKDFPPQFLDVIRHADPATLSWAPLLLRLPWNVLFGPTHKGNIVVTGDAMHPMTPDLGQGGCAALEDAVVLGRNLAACLRLDGRVERERVAGCLAKFVEERRWRVSRLIAGSFMSGWIQQGGSGWWERVVKFVRDSAFYRFLFPKLVSAIVDYDCGSLPAPLRV